jgi:hypothetical protein
MMFAKKDKKNNALFNYSRLNRGLDSFLEGIGIS